MLTGDITKAAIAELNLRGFKMWRNNNAPVARNRKFLGEYGVSDAIGYHKLTGVATYCETKNEDKLSDDQIKFLDAAKMSGCHCFIATVDKKGSFILKDY